MSEFIGQKSFNGFRAMKEKDQDLRKFRAEVSTDRLEESRDAEQICWPTLEAKQADRKKRLSTAMNTCGKTGGVPCASVLLAQRIK